MLRRLSADDPRFRTVDFRPGLNLLLAEAHPGAARTDSRNGTGKSSLVELLHFALGARAGKGSLPTRPKLRNTLFTLTMDWPGQDDPLQVSRRGAQPGIVLTDLPGVAEDGGLFAIRLTREMPLPEWTARIETDLFRLPGDHPGVSGRSLMSLLVRRVGSHAFNDPVRTYPQQSAAEAAANLAYLLGLDWRLASGYRDIAVREATRRQLRSAMNDPTWNQVVGTTADLRGKIIVAEGDVDRLRREIAAFRVVPAYEELQRRADELDQRVRSLPEQDVIDRRNLADLRRAVDEANDPDMAYVDAVYQELGITLPGRVHRTFEDVRGFHASIVRNRRRYLADETTETEARLAERERARLGEQLTETLTALREGGALDGLTALQQLLAQKQAALEALRKQHETAQFMEASQREITARRVELQEALELDLEERGEQTREATWLFSRFARRLYGQDRDAYLTIRAGTSSMEITAHVDSRDSVGINKMVIFCLDLTAAVIAHRHGRGPDFLVHDSHLFDGVDDRQVTEALALASEVADEEGLQYIATFNSDKLERARLGGFDPSSHLIEPRLDDTYDEGGLFGFWF
ncbi:ABC-three component system protein [Streptomyces sp. I05A-00742]|uniref:ABC-three component system protein n=1 Tax=Streptomyces sp. I05A-00742 TaxID=2732853 RepID=UPI0014878E49|nr:ABC-three component system protein [Streptomyces sp. I05A-00742]